MTQSHAMLGPPVADPVEAESIEIVPLDGHKLKSGDTVYVRAVLVESPDDAMPWLHLAVPDRGPIDALIHRLVNKEGILVASDIRFRPPEEATPGSDPPPPDTPRKRGRPPKFVAPELREISPLTLESPTGSARVDNPQDSPPQPERAEQADHPGDVEAGD